MTHNMHNGNSICKKANRVVEDSHKELTRICNSVCGLSDKNYKLLDWMEWNR